MEEVKDSKTVFVRTVTDSVWYTYVAVMAKSLENRSQAASIFYILRVDESSFNRYQASNPFDVSDILEISEKIKLVRDKSHFHVDRDFSTNDSFHEASIPWGRLEAIIDYLYGYLTFLRIDELGFTGLTDRGYSVNDAKIATIAIEGSGCT